MRQTYDIPTTPTPSFEGVQYGTTPNDTPRFNPEMSGRVRVDTLLALLVLAHATSFRFPGAARDGNSLFNGYGTYDEASASFDSSRSNDPVTAYSEYVNSFFDTDTKDAPTTSTMFKDVFTGFENDSQPRFEEPTRPTETASLYDNTDLWTGMRRIKEFYRQDSVPTTPVERPAPTEEQIAAQKLRKEKIRGERLAQDIAAKDSGLEWITEHPAELGRIEAEITERDRQSMEEKGEPLSYRAGIKPYAFEANMTETGEVDPEATRKFQLVDAYLKSRKN